MDSLRTVILDYLHDIETNHEVRILLAVESGSRSWGFESPDSDYDVRFIYAHRREWYLSIEEGRDVIELPVHDALDISGWDLRKALRLFRKSNPVLSEWLVSPLIYCESGAFAEELRALTERYYSRKAAAYHYLNMSRNNYNRYLSDHPEVNLKKYLYVLRPLVNILWLMEREGLIPMSFLETLDAVTVPSDARTAIADLLVRKKATSEIGRGKRIPAIDRLIIDLIEREEAYCQTAPVNKPPLEEVNALFCGILDEQREGYTS